MNMINIFYRVIFLVIFLLFFQYLNVYAAGADNRCSKPVIFPLLSKPINDTGQEYDNYDWRSSHGANQAVYKSYRIRQSSAKNITKKSFHAARDLYTDVYNDKGNYNLLKSRNYVIAVSDGKVLEVGYFYAGTYKVTVLHNTCDGRSFIIRYGELDPESIKVSVGQDILQGQILGRPGFLSKKDKKQNRVPINVILDKVVFMLHFEYFSKGEVTDEPFSKAFSDNRFDRRADIEDALDILEEGYVNSFGELLKP